jgi:hypothetical protein
MTLVRLHVRVRGLAAMRTTAAHVARIYVVFGTSG